MKQLFTYLSLILCCHAAFAADTTRVLFIGNSFTATGNVPGLVRSFAQEAGKHFEVYEHTPGGISVGDVSQGNMAHMNNPDVYNLIRNNRLDYVVIQDNQGRFVEDHAFPNPAVSKVVEGHTKIRDSMRHYHSCASMVFFAGWALKNCWPDIGNGEKCIRNIYDNYLTLNGMLNEIVSPIGIAWLRSINQLPAVDLWSPDEAHQSNEGSYLTAAVIFTSIYRINTEHVHFSAGFDTAAERVMRRIAYETVVDSIQPTGLSAFVPTLIYNGGTLTAATGYSRYDWYRNDTLVHSSTTSTFIPLSKSCYNVVVTDNNGCKLRSDSVCISNPPITGINTTNKASLRITPNPAQNNISINAGLPGIAKQYTIVNMMGNVVSSGNFTAASTTLGVQHLPAGIYICNLNAEGITLREKILKN